MLPFPSCRWRMLGLALLPLLPVLPVLVPAQEPATSLEYRVKAAYLVNFVHYVEWPADAFQSRGDSLVLCVIGHDPFGGELARAARSRTPNARPIRVEHREEGSRAQGCHVAFLSRRSWRRNPRLLDRLNRPGLLTVGEGQQFVESGGIIGFVIVNETVRFVVNLRAGNQADLRISSRMLALALDLIGREGLFH